MTPYERVQRVLAEIKGCASLYGVDSWDKALLQSVGSRSTLTDNQEKALKRIEEKVFDDESEE